MRLFFVFIALCSHLIAIESSSIPRVIQKLEFGKAGALDLDQALAGGEAAPVNTQARCSRLEKSPVRAQGHFTCFALRRFTGPSPCLRSQQSQNQLLNHDGYKQVVIIGAGPTTLGFLHRFCEQAGYGAHAKILVFEQQSAPGGLAQSIRDPQGFLFDYGGHVLFSHYIYFDQILDRAVSKWNYLQRESYAFMKGSDGVRRFIPYPVQNNIDTMAKIDRNECLQGLELATKLSPKNQGSFEDWLLQTFGKPLYTKFMLPYNKKVWTVNPSEMNATWVGERVAMPDYEKIQARVKSADDNESHHVFVNPLSPRKDDGWGPNNQFRYPAKGGNGSIWQSIANQIPRSWIQYGKRVVAINTEQKVLHVEDVESKTIATIAYDALVSTIPLDIFIKSMIDDDESIQSLKAQQERFVHTRTHVVGVGLEGKPPYFLNDKSWMYFPDSDSPFYRITVFSNYSSDHVPSEKYWSLMCECAESTTEESDRWKKQNVIDTTIDSLANYGFIDKAAVVSTFYQKLEYGYPVPFLERDEVLNIVQPILESRSIYSRGRFGGWKYEVSNQDHSFMQGVELADYLFKGIPELTYPYPNRANAPGKR